MDQIIPELQKVGFSLYEARAYISLLQNAPVTGYELSKRSGIPRAMIYEVLNKLRERGAVHLVPSDPIQYIPVPASEFLDRLRRSTESTIHTLETSLNNLSKPPEVNVIQHIQGKEKILAEIKSLIHRTQKELWLSLWEPQVATLAQDVLECEKNGKRILSVIFGETHQPLGRTFFHNYMPPEVVVNRLGGQLHIAARDGEEVIIAEFLQGAPPWAVSSRDSALVLVATEYIRHDIMIDVILQAYGEDRLNALWMNDPDLVHVVTGKNG